MKDRTEQQTRALIPFSEDRVRARDANRFVAQGRYAGGISKRCRSALENFHTAHRRQAAASHIESQFEFT